MAAGLIDAELADGHEVVVLRVVPVDELDPLIAALIPFGQARDGNAFKQQRRHALVDLKELADTWTGQG